MSLAGCNKPGQEFSIPGLVKSFAPPTPSEVAREAFDLSDPDKRRRSVTLLSAAPYGGDEPYLKMYRLLIDDPDATVRAACVKALGLHGEVKDAEVILASLTDPVQIVRWEAAKALQKIHNPIAVKPLIKAVREDDDADVRMASAYALGQYTEPGVFNALVLALDDRDYAVIHAAVTSLRTLTGQDFDNDGEAWLAWSQDNREQLFAQRQPYQWQPFVKPRGLIDKAQFWKEHNPPQPRPPTGLEQTAASGS